MHLKKNFVRNYQSEKIWNLSDVLFKVSSFSFLSQCKGNITSQRLCFSLHIALNYSLSSVFYYCTDILMLRNIKNLSKSCFSPLQYFHFWCIFFKKHVQISHVSVKLVITIEKNGWKLNTSNFSTIKWIRWKLTIF